MDIRIKRATAVAGIATALALPLSSQASDGTITFTGAVTASTCVLVVNGGTAGVGDATVALPVVGQSALDTSVQAKTTAAGTFFNIGLNSCTAASDITLPGPTHAPSTVQVYFEAGPNVDQVTGGLINAGGGSNVEVNLYNVSGATKVTTQIMPGTSIQAPTQLISGLGSTTTTVLQWYYAGYSTAGRGLAATVGAVNTSVTYSLIYN